MYHSFSMKINENTHTTYLNGWQIAMYRSTVNDVIVSTVAFVDVSDNNPCNTQIEWLNGYVAGNHILYVSCGMPKKNKK